MAEQRGGGIRTQATALLAVIAVVGGIGASAIGTLGSRDFSSLSFEVIVLHSVPGEVVLLIPLGLAALCVLIAGAITLRALRDKDVSAQATKDLMETYGSLVKDEADDVAVRLLDELAYDYVRIENAVSVARRGLVRASWWLGAGVLLGVVVGAILIATSSNPLQTQLVKSPQLEKAPIVVRLQRSPNGQSYRHHAKSRRRARRLFK